MLDLLNFSLLVSRLFYLNISYGTVIVKKKFPSVETWIWGFKGFVWLVLLFCFVYFFLVPGSATGFQGNVRQIIVLHSSSAPYTGFYCDYSFKRAFKWNNPLLLCQTVWWTFGWLEQIVSCSVVSDAQMFWHNSGSGRGTGSLLRNVKICLNQVLISWSQSSIQCMFIMNEQI